MDPVVTKSLIMAGTLMMALGAMALIAAASFLGLHAITPFPGTKPSLTTRTIYGLAAPVFLFAGAFLGFLSFHIAFPPWG